MSAKLNYYRYYHNNTSRSGYQLGLWEIEGIDVLRKSRYIKGLRKDKKLFVINSWLEKLAIGNMIFCSAVYRKESWHRVNGYDKQLKYGWEDWDFWISILKNGGTVVKLNYIGFYYRVKKKSMLRDMTEEQIRYSSNYISVKHIEFIINFTGSPRFLCEKINNLEHQLDDLKKYEKFYKRISNTILYKVYCKIKKYFKQHNLYSAFTICSNNYFARAVTLAQSFSEHHSDSEIFYVIITDVKNEKINYSIPGIEILFISDIEPEYEKLINKYNLVEFATSVKASTFEYLFQLQDFKYLIYLDPDIFIYSNLDIVLLQIQNYDVIITPHILTPIDIDDHTPFESAFNNVGIYNLGFLTLRKSDETTKLLKWWKERLFLYCKIDVSNGLFTDQIFFNHVPIFFKNVYILNDFGYNVAPWNLHERFISILDGKYFVNNEYQLKFYHFSTFCYNIIELPFQKYDRYKIQNRNDLYDLYFAYNEKLRYNNEEKYFKILNYFEIQRIEITKQKNINEYKAKPFFIKSFWKILKLVPVSFRKKALYFISKSISWSWK